MFYANKHFNFCCFRSLAYTSLDRLRAVIVPQQVMPSIASSRGITFSAWSVVRLVVPLYVPCQHKAGGVGDAATGASNDRGWSVAVECYVIYAVLIKFDVGDVSEI